MVHGSFKLVDSEKNQTKLNAISNKWMKIFLKVSTKNQYSRKSPIDHRNKYFIDSINIINTVFLFSKATKYFHWTAKKWKICVENSWMKIHYNFPEKICWFLLNIKTTFKKLKFEIWVLKVFRISLTKFLVFRWKITQLWNIEIFLSHFSVRCKKVVDYNRWKYDDKNTIKIQIK